MEETEDQLEWDFSILSSVNISSIFFVLVRIIHIYFQSATKQNRLTFKILKWFFLNQVII